MRSISSSLLKYRHKALTLLEIIAVIAIVGILASVILPATTFVTEKAKRTKAASNLRQIAIAYSSCLHMGNLQDMPDTIHTWASKLAQKTGLNDPKIWILSEDPCMHRTKKPMPKSVHNGQGVPTDSFADHAISIVIAHHINPLSSPSTTPIAWTRGLNADGYWDRDHGVYSDQGGFIAFLDGHVEWFDNIADIDKQLCKYNTTETTSNIYEALNPGATILQSI